MALGARIDIRRFATRPTRPKPEGGNIPCPSRSLEARTSNMASGNGGKSFALDRLSNYNTCKWMDNLEEQSLVSDLKLSPSSPYKPLTLSQDIISYFKPSSNLPSSDREADISEEDIASVPNNVQAGTPEDRESRPTYGARASQSGTLSLRHALPGDPMAAHGET